MFNALGSIALYWGSFLAVLAGLAVGVVGVVTRSSGFADGAKDEMLALIYILATCRYFLRQNVKPYVDVVSGQATALTRQQKIWLLILNVLIVSGYGIAIGLLAEPPGIALTAILCAQTWFAIVILLFTGFLRIVGPRDTDAQKHGLQLALGDVAYAFFSTLIFSIAANSGIDAIQDRALIVAGAVMTFVFLFECSSIYPVAIGRCWRDTQRALV